jgi:hypothetical protein
MEQELKTHLLCLGRIYGDALGLAPTTVGKRVARDARFFERLEEGKGFTVKTYDTVIAWFSCNWPAAAAWPDDIPRPEIVDSGAAA